MYKKYIKRFLDLVLTLIALIILIPLMTIIAILVRIKLGRPIIFKQKRPGKDEKIFTLYKFRTMTDEKDSDGNLLTDSKRLTKFGKVLRSTSLDELPEIFNIIKGDMSIVGPRPLLLRYLPFYTEEERKRHEVRPGLTGLAQIHGRNYTNWNKRFELDVKYVKEISLKTDIIIIKDTIKKVLKKEGILMGDEHIMQDLDKERENMSKEIYLKDINIELLEEYKNDFLNYIKLVLDKNEIISDKNSINQIFNNMKNFIKDKSAIIIGAFKQNRLLGFIWGYKITVYNEKRIHINYFIVNELYRKKGIGSKLIESLYKKAKNDKILKIELMVTSNNEEAIKFYQNQGFNEERVKLCKKI